MTIESKNSSVIICTGGFDPIHSGHIAYFENAKSIANILVVGVNSDEWLIRKKGQSFMNFDERCKIVSSLKMVDKVISFNDNDGSAKDAIRICLDLYPHSNIIFANGGDRTNENIPEMQLSCTDSEMKRIKFIFGVGGQNKINSSSKILTEWKTPKTQRSWGFYRVLHSDGPTLKVKELVVEPYKSLSLQKHSFRSEHWMVSFGTAKVKIGNDLNSISLHTLKKNDEIDIHAGQWHQLINETNEELRIVEIQYGINCIEEDIERI